MRTRASTRPPKRPIRLLASLTRYAHDRSSRGRAKCHSPPLRPPPLTRSHSRCPPRRALPALNRAPALMPARPRCTSAPRLSPALGQPPTEPRPRSRPPDGRPLPPQIEHRLVALDVEVICAAPIPQREV